MIFDFHNDILTSGLTKNYIKRVVKNNFNDSVVYVFWSTKLNDDPLKTIKRAFKSIKLPKKDFFAIEDLHFLHVYQVKELKSIPVLYCGLTWNYDNALAGGALGASGLTDKGEQIITELNNNKIIIDTAHLNSKSFYQVVEKADSVINSHTSLNNLHSHPRNLNDEQIELIIQKKGIIALTAVKDFLGGNSINDYIKHIDSFCEKFNIENLCIGTDFYGSTPLEGLQNYNDFDIIRYRLTNLGYSIENIDKIFYLNAKKFIASK